MILSLGLSFAALALPPSGTALSRKAHAMHRTLFTLDTHCDTPWLLLKPGFDIGVRHEPGTLLGGMQDLVRMKEGGLAASFFAVYVNQGPLTDEGRADAGRKAEELLEALARMFREHPDLCALALTPEDAHQIHRSGRRAIFLGLENGYPIGRDLAKVNAFHASGIRYITLAHNRDNDLCASATDRAGKPDGGLTNFGRQVVARMNDLGIMVDISHISPQSVADVLTLSRAPVLASHSSARALCDHPRNLSDDQLRAVRGNGGVVQVCFVPDFLRKLPRDPARAAAEGSFWKRMQALRTLEAGKARTEAEAALERDWKAHRRRFPAPKVTVKDLVDHVDHIVKTIGVDHVGLGTDFDGGGGLSDCADVTELPRITEELLRRGYSEEDIGKIWGGNALRVMRAVQAAATPQPGAPPA